MLNSVPSCWLDRIPDQKALRRGSLLRQGARDGIGINMDNCQMAVTQLPNMT